MFYPDIKPHLSPSAFAQWHRQKTSFIRSYFLNERTPETSAMKAGTRIHALIEAGFLKVENRFTNFEETITAPVYLNFDDPVKKNIQVNLLGIPDSHEIADTPEVRFVDYKTGKENRWTPKQLAQDLKMRFTALLVLLENRRRGNDPQSVRGYIEWIGTEWNGKELVPTGETEVLEIYYSKEELDAFSLIIISTIEEINQEYENFSSAPKENLVSEEDIAEYAELEAKKKEIELKQSVIKERVFEVMKFSGQQNVKHDLGSFSIATSKKYQYPDDLEFQTESGNIMTLALGEEILVGLSSAKKNYELNHEPVSVTHSIKFNAPRAKKK